MSTSTAERLREAVSRLSAPKVATPGLAARERSRAPVAAPPGLTEPQRKRVQLVARSAKDATLLHVARALARRLSDYDTWTAKPHIELNLCDLTLRALSHGKGDEEWGRALAKCPEEQERLTKALVQLGLVVKDGRGARARYLLAPRELPNPDVVAAVVLVELGADRRVEALVVPLAASSPGLALLGLEGERAREALRAASGHGPLQLDYLAGQERLIDRRIFQEGSGT